MIKAIKTIIIKLLTKLEIMKKRSDNSVESSGEKVELSLRCGEGRLTLRDPEIVKSDEDHWKVAATISGTVEVVNEALKDASWTCGQSIVFADADGEWNLKLGSTVFYQPDITSSECSQRIQILVDKAERASGEDGVYQFIIPNADFGLPDHETLRPLPPDAQDRYPGMKVSHGWAKDHCQFTLKGVVWTLRSLFRVDDDLMSVGKIPSDHKLGESDYWALEVSSDDLPEADAQAVATDICWILGLAAANRVMWNTMRVVSPDDTRLVLRRSIALAPRAKGSSSVIANFGDGKLQRFMEAAYPVFLQDEDWWKVTLNWYVLVHENYTIELGGVICSMLFDRISNFRLRNEKFPKQIDPALDKKLGKRKSESWEKARSALGGAVSQFCDNWNTDRSDALLDKIREWNNQPSYPRKIAKALEGLPIPEPDKNLVGPRHRLLHNGQLDLHGIGPVEYFSGIIDLVTSMLLAMMGYSGPYFVVGKEGQILPSGEAILEEATCEEEEGNVDSAKD